MTTEPWDDPSEADIRAFIAGVQPGQFAAPVTSATTTRDNAAPDFPTFHRTNLAELLELPDDAAGVAELANVSEVRRLHQSPGEPTSAFVDRLGGEAARMEATWLFVTTPLDAPGRLWVAQERGEEALWGSSHDTPTQGPHRSFGQPPPRDRTWQLFQRVLAPRSR